MCSVFKPGKDLDTTPLFSDSHDLPILKLRQNKTYGRFLGHPALGQFIAESSSTARKKLRKNNPNDFRRRVGIVGRYDTHIGHFGESAMAMWEVSRHFPKEGPSKWTAGIAQMLFGPASEVLAGHREGRPVCFDQVAFVLNSRHLNSSAQGFREDAWGLAEVAAKVFQRREENGVVGDGNGDFEVEEEMEMGEEEQEKQRRAEAGSESQQTKKSREESREESERRFREEVIARERRHALARVVIRQGDEVLNAALRGYDFERKLEVTVVEREEQRTVSNMGEVAWHVKDLFPRQLTNQYHLADSPLLEQMALFQHTALFISMHGASLSNLIFLPPGSTILELFPFKFHSDAYKNLALRTGINYFMWENTHPEASTYTDDCLAKGGWENLEEKECRNVRGCFLCARDHSVTRVNMEELDKVLLKVQRAVRRFLHEESLKKLHGVTTATVTA
ncbi:unnamed protein product [Closterium sp. Yama58-4]|nr:unnamed protein product [Closterium sp. Yama58-4]